MHVKWILVVEKEASFNSLVEAKFDQSTALGPGILITVSEPYQGHYSKADDSFFAQAKGYPDLQSRIFVKHLVDTISPVNRVKLYGLFDGDPDGLEIYRCYKNESGDSSKATNIQIPEIEFLGVNLCEYLGHSKVLNQAVSMTVRDRGRARAMLDRLHEFGDQQERHRVQLSLQTMLMLGVKMEIQALNVEDGGLQAWLERRMCLSC